jgi:TRAP-type C4-dicarboxylate transport system permease small subunit
LASNVKQTMDNIVKKIGWVSNGAIIISGFMIALMSLITAYAVIRRYVFHAPEPYSYEVINMLLLFSFVFAVAAVDQQQRHIRADFLSARWSPYVQNILLNIIGGITGLIVSVLLIWKTFSSALTALEFHSKSQSQWAVPLFPIKLMIPIGFILLTLILLTRIYIGFKTLNDNKVKEKKV